LLQELQDGSRGLHLMSGLRGAEQKQEIIRFALHQPILLGGSQRVYRPLIDIEQESGLLTTVYHIASLLFEIEGVR
jgi:hypothetical protein